MVILFNMKYGGSMQTNKTVLFSSLCLGAKFRYINKEKIYVKIAHNPGEGCIADWNYSLQSSTWIGQGIYCLNDEGKDMYVELVIENEIEHKQKK